MTVASRTDWAPSPYPPCLRLQRLGFAGRAPTEPLCRGRPAGLGPSVALDSPHLNVASSVPCAAAVPGRGAVTSHPSPRPRDSASWTPPGNSSDANGDVGASPCVFERTMRERTTGYRRDILRVLLRGEPAGPDRAHTARPGFPTFSSMISVSNIGKSYGDRVLFAGGSFQLKRGGCTPSWANGRGKTNLPEHPVRRWRPRRGRFPPERLRPWRVRQDRSSLRRRAHPWGTHSSWDNRVGTPWWEEEITGNAAGTFDSRPVLELEETVQRLDGLHRRGPGLVIPEGARIPERQPGTPSGPLRGLQAPGSCWRRSLASTRRAWLLDEPPQPIAGPILSSPGWTDLPVCDFPGPGGVNSPMTTGFAWTMVPPHPLDCGTTRRRSPSTPPWANYSDFLEIQGGRSGGAAGRRTFGAREEGDRPAASVVGALHTRTLGHPQGAGQAPEQEPADESAGKNGGLQWRKLALPVPPVSQHLPVPETSAPQPGRNVLTLEGESGKSFRGEGGPPRGGPMPGGPGGTGWPFMGPTGSAEVDSCLKTPGGSWIGRRHGGSGGVRDPPRLLRPGSQGPVRHTTPHGRGVDLELLSREGPGIRRGDGMALMLFSGE